MHNYALVKPSNYTEQFSTILLPFILRHRHILEKLSFDIRVPQKKIMVDLSSLFPSLDERFPHLTSLAITVPLEYLYRNDLHTPVINHSDILQELKIGFYKPFLSDDVPITPDQLFSLPIFLVPLPELKSLDLELWSWPQTERRSVSRNLVDYLLPMNQSLTTLILRYCLFSFDELQALLDLSKNSFPQLLHLQIYVCYLSADIFDLLAVRLPQLSHLHISFDMLGDNLSDSTNSLNTYSTNVHVFNMNMKLRQYTNWSLRHLDVALMGNAAGRWQECQVVITKALPYIVTINGVIVE
ncbi:hypothetical protein BDZ97DRAFT_1958507 [Flammula alnicola]|nr:hypothetical protein BDZ97DRAFT_1958507 [Flammula alnicola]